MYKILGGLSAIFASGATLYSAIFSLLAIFERYIEPNQGLSITGSDVLDIFIITPFVFGILFLMLYMWIVLPAFVAAGTYKFISELPQREPTPD
jgi:hypothetical protein